MEPTNLLAAALIAGHTTLDEAGKDAYKGLKSLIKSMFQGDKSAERALEGHEEDPDGYDPLLKKALESRKVHENPEAIELARRVMEAKDPVGSEQGKYNVTISNSHGVQVGHNNTQTNNWK